MRVPAPAALLVEHPAVPVPEIDGSAKVPLLEDGTVAAPSLSRRDRFSAALQLTAAAALLAEFDLWPGTAAVRNAAFVRASSGVQACLGGFPMPMSIVFKRLGGGEGAAATIRKALLEAVSEAVDLPVTAIDLGTAEPGFFLEGAISRQLRELKKPLDHVTARSLWAFRWDGLPIPEDGGTTYWRVPIAALGRRFGGAMWAALRRRGDNAWLWTAGDEDVGTAPVPALGSEGTLILVGEVSSDELAAVSRWSRRDGCRAVLIGTFPSGWYPPRPPGFDREHANRHLAVTGLPLEEARRVVEHRCGRIDPLDSADRRALTESARRVFSSGGSRTATGPDSSACALRDILSLSPDGLPPGFVALQSGLTQKAIAARRHELPVVETGGKWRLTESVSLEPDPRHTAVAELFPDRDPRRLLHLALGGGATGEIEAWARAGLDALEAHSVRDLLTVVEPGALGPVVTAMQCEACLAICDLSGARRAIAALPRDRGDALTTWLDGIDDRSGTRRRLPSVGQVEISPRAVAETALLVLNEDRRRGGSRVDEARALLDRAVPLLSFLLQRRIEIELAWINDGTELADPEWRRRVVGDHQVLRAQYAHRRALQLMDRGHTRAARRLLGLLAVDRHGPGFLGVIEHDLGAAALDAGDSRQADAHQLRALRLLQAAGFRHFTRRVRFNLAVGDLDQLEIERAERRFSELAAEDPNDPYVSGELARLELAKGNLSEFRRRLDGFARSIDPDDARFAEALRFLLGVAALFDGDLVGAASLLKSAGQEGEVWSSLIETVAGREEGSWLPDGWGVGIAAELVHDHGSEDGGVVARLEAERMTRPRALGIAVAERTGRIRLPIGETTRVAAAGTLRAAGMGGWADALAGVDTGREGSVVEALAEIVDGTTLENLDPDIASRLLVSLGVTGIELRDALTRRPAWRFGGGTPGTEIRRGRVVVVPLGGEAHAGPAWRLANGIFELFAPSAATPAEPEVEETGFFGTSNTARSVRRELYELGPTHLPVLLIGETGVGKEVAARALHRLSKRRGPFVPVNVAAIPATLLEAELFGSIKGAFTGADRSRRGLTVAADHGTLFLDEVGDLDPPLQVKLLRFLESQEVRAVGATESQKVDVRIVSATHHDLEQRVREGRFRQDLYYRIAAPPLSIPPLRERREDILLLRDLFEREAVSRHGLQTAAWGRESEAVLRNHRWPGNVRELRQAVEVALVRAAGAVVLPEHLPIPEADISISGTWEHAQREFRRRFLGDALARNGGNRSATARELGISRQALLYHLRNLGITDT